MVIISIAEMTPELLGKKKKIDSIQAILASGIVGAAVYGIVEMLA